MDFINIFNDREKAIIIWLVVFFIWFLSKKDRRDSIKPIVISLLKQLFWGKVAVALLIMSLYISLLVFVAYLFHVWDFSLLKDTILWFIGGAFIMFLHSNKVTSEEHYFKGVLLESVKFTVVIEFVTNLYTLNLIGELILVPIATLLVAMLAFIEKKEQYAQVKKLLNGLYVIIGLGILIFAFSHVVGGFKDFATLQNLKSFLLTPVLTIAFLPFIYFLALYSTYTLLFLRINLWLKNDKALVKFTKRQIWRSSRLNLKKLKKVSEKMSGKLTTIKSKADVTVLIQQVRSKP